jgi:hypothetical protein
VRRTVCLCYCIARSEAPHHRPPLQIPVRPLPQPLVSPPPFSPGRHGAVNPGRSMRAPRAVRFRGGIPRSFQVSPFAFHPFRRFCTGGALLPPRAPLADPYQSSAPPFHVLEELRHGHPRIRISPASASCHLTSGPPKAHPRPFRALPVPPFVLRCLTRLAADFASLAAEATVRWRYPRAPSPVQNASGGRHCVTDAPRICHLRPSARIGGSE